MCVLCRGAHFHCFYFLFFAFVQKKIQSPVFCLYFWIVILSLVLLMGSIPQEPCTGFGKPFCVTGQRPHGNDEHDCSALRPLHQAQRLEGALPDGEQVRQFIVSSVCPVLVHFFFRVSCRAFFKFAGLLTAQTRHPAAAGLWRAGNHPHQCSWLPLPLDLP